MTNVEYLAVSHQLSLVLTWPSLMMALAVRQDSLHMCTCLDVRALFWFRFSRVWSDLYNKESSITGSPLTGTRPSKFRLFLLFAAQRTPCAHPPHQSNKGLILLYLKGCRHWPLSCLVKSFPDLCIPVASSTTRLEVLICLVAVTLALVAIISVVSTWCFGSLYLFTGMKENTVAPLETAMLQSMSQTHIGFWFNPEHSN
ncbi:hypothetical protein FF38_12045 [Lucilia cuprina]|uniref:Uncharacterized protein n=1 Tax=Lucilia cuprina TaxID=7375 RepID=A0A0L0CNR3_LUCCU|nr:hypothetical protein FF38_12045 [Lucilia cuprina]